jgi:transposase
VVVPPVDHECALKDLVEDLANRLAKLEHENAQLKKAVLGSRSEKSKMPRIKTGAPATAEDRQKTRRERAAAKAQAPTVRVEHKVPDAERRCTACGNEKLDPLGDGKTTTVWEFVPARFLRVEHVQEVLRCRCNGFVVTAPGAPKVVEKGQYGASFLAHLAVSKCADHTPIYRIEKAFQRQGIPVARSTMNELLHRASAILEPVWKRLLDVVRVRPVVGADETRLRLVRDKDGKTKNGFVWTFGARDDEGELDIAYVFTEDRSGSTPKTLLEGTSGVLLVDGYSGYNVVDEVSTRRRVACHAHLRRYFYEALPTAPVAQEMLDLVAELYVAEHAADAQGLIGVSKLDFRKKRAGPIGGACGSGSWRSANAIRPRVPSPAPSAIRASHSNPSMPRGRGSSASSLGTTASTGTAPSGSSHPTNGTAGVTSTSWSPAATCTRPRDDGTRLDGVVIHGTGTRPLRCPSICATGRPALGRQRSSASERL